MRKTFRVVGTVLSVLAITLFLDAMATATVLPGLINTDRDAAEAGNLGVYIGAPHHHDIIPGIATPRVWGRIIYPWKADKYGLRTGTCAPGDAEKAWPAIFVIGDSFVEATLLKNYIEGDVHFTPAGNRLIYETVRQAVDGNW
jgi:hypothetical protein